MNSSQKVVQSIHQPLDLQNWFILETPFHRSHDNSKSPPFQISSMQFDSDWEETLNDIDELIQSELRCTGPLSEETQPFVETRVEQLSAPKHVWTNDPSKESSTDHEWSFTGKAAFCKFHWLSFDTGQREIQRIIGAGLLKLLSTGYKMQGRGDFEKPWFRVRIRQIIRRPILPLAVYSGWIHESWLRGFTFAWSSCFILTVSQNHKYKV